MRFLVTGAAGFIGSNLSARLANSGFEVVGADNYTEYYSPGLKKLRVKELLNPLGVPVELIDLTEIQSVRSLVEAFQPDTIIHLAAQPGVRTPIEKSDLYIQSNLVAYCNVLQAAVEFGVPNFLYASSSSVYGNSREHPYREENKSIVPISIYGATKLANEILAPVYVSGSNTRSRGMRFFTVYGPWGRPDMAYLRVINSALNGSEFKKFGNGEVKRDFTFVDDISRMIESLAFQLKTCQAGFADVVNIGGGNPHSLNDLVREVSNQMNSKITVSETSINPLDTDYTFADVTRLIELTGQKPEIKLEMGVSETIAWAKRPDIQSSLSSWVESTI